MGATRGMSHLKSPMRSSSSSTSWNLIGDKRWDRHCGAQSWKSLTLLSPEACGWRTLLLPWGVTLDSKMQALQATPARWMALMAEASRFCRGQATRMGHSPSPPKPRLAHLEIGVGYTTAQNLSLDWECVKSG